jgi:hypothetical protein
MTGALATGISGNTHNLLIYTTQQVRRIVLCPLRRNAYPDIHGEVDVDHDDDDNDSI